MKTGKVYIVGAGPYMEDLITLKGLNAIKTADVIIYDRLVNKNLLRLAKDEAIYVYCGKEPKNHTLSQDEIIKLMIDYAKKGFNVVRLKGGDPYIFGRGAEEAEKLFENNISFEVIPGISSFCSALTFAGIPITYRKLAREFHVFTGHTCNDEELNWNVISKLDGTLVFLMSAENVENISQKLISHGKEPKTLAAAVINATTGRQKVISGYLEDFASGKFKNQVASPMVFVIGEVIRFRNKLSFYESLPLYGKRICITRPKSVSGNIKNLLLSLGADVVDGCCSRLVPHREEIDKIISFLPEYDILVFTSVNGVDSFFDYLIEKKIDIRNIKGDFAAIGKKTALALQKRGFGVKYIPDEHSSDGLIRIFKNEVDKSKKILTVQSKIAGDYLKNALASLGFEVDTIFAYSMEFTKNPNDAVYDSDIYVFTSSGMFRHFIECYGTDMLFNKIVISIGEHTKKTLESFGIQSIACDEATDEGIVNKILEVVKNGV
ncbi:uroporphyrin-III C-methyltransferase [Caldicellulosiruptor acetigenus I77R1B]|uniref:uroporphyrinogen-III C-methyltransferase n=1 Tax=Caldicellulosiruptor acetigenus (strain ATCC 700853 / DSM 12137 / I77R1B) TaxID=632335 RepID=E4S6S4_CALA7|nr:uroporphyrinogen-III C-methyltransferase [Caldicellulosiruptor acetigenus]ADQ40689.1 uroporphyrin-III C-methyltransferase [Caldicellulosiruptor acetigenus I77R1B]